MSTKCISVARKLYVFLNMLQPWHPRSLFRSSTLHSDWTFDFFQPWCFWFGNDRVSDASRSYRSMLATVGSRFLESWTSLLSSRIFGLFGTECSDVKFLASKWPTVCRWFFVGKPVGIWHAVWFLTSNFAMSSNRFDVWVLVQCRSSHFFIMYPLAAHGCTWCLIFTSWETPLNIEVRWPAYVKSWLNGEYHWSSLPKINIGEGQNKVGLLPGSFVQ